MTDICDTYAYDLALPKKDPLWSAIVCNEKKLNSGQQTQQPQLSAFSLAVLKEIQDYDKHRAKHFDEKTNFSLVLATDLNTVETLQDSNSEWMCAICLDSLPEKNPNSISCVTCQFCVPCLFQYVQLQIEEKSANMTSKWSMRCPCLLPGCELATGDIERIINNTAVPTDTEQKKESSITLLEKFHKFALDLEIQNDPTRVFCPERDCAAVVTLPRNPNSIFSSHQAKCHDCKHSFCTKCNNSHSRFTSCDMASESQFNRWRKSTRQGVKKCPGCRIYIEKNAGCSHMTCRACGQHFCWNCLRPTHGDSVLCSLLSLSNSERWGTSTVTRAATKTLAVPGALAVGGVVVGAAGVAAGVVVAGGCLLLCASPFIVVTQKCRERRRLRTLAMAYDELLQTEIFLRGIVIIFPPSSSRSSSSTQDPCFSAVVDSLIADMPGVTAGDMPTGLSPDPPYRVAYTGSYVLYFTTTPSSVPGYDPEDYPTDLFPSSTSSGSVIKMKSSFTPLDEEFLRATIKPVMNRRRAYIQMPPSEVFEAWKRSCRHNSPSPTVRPGEVLSDALNHLYTMTV